MPNKSHGFTLVELMIVVAVVAILAAIAIPNLIAGRINANESAAIATLRNLMATQMQARVSGIIDSDHNGVGEYGFFQELSGTRSTRSDSDDDGLADSESQIWIEPPVMSSYFGDLDSEGLIQRSGYMFRLYLPGAGGVFQRELAPSEPYAAVSAELAANYWACYAWPARYGITGRRAFFVNQEGQVLACSNAETRYTGYSVVVASFLQGIGGKLAPGKRVGKKRAKKGKKPARPGRPADRSTSPSAALLAGNSLMSGKIAVNTIGQDGNLWTTVR